jgi:hypothetical protein
MACQTEQQLQGRADQIVLPTSLLEDQLHMLQTTKCTDAFGFCDCSRPGAERARYELLYKKNGKWGHCIVTSFRLLDLFLYIVEHMYVVTAVLVITYVQV